MREGLGVGEAFRSWVRLVLNHTLLFEVADSSCQKHLFLLLLKWAVFMLGGGYREEPKMYF